MMILFFSFIVLLAICEEVKKRRADFIGILVFSNHVILYILCNK